MKLNSKTFLRSALTLTALTTMTFPSLGHTSGFEKSVLWSGHWSPLGGAASSAVTGAESLYFNPAGLGANKGIEVSGNFSPVFAKFTAPLLANDTSVESSRKFTPTFGVFASYNVTEKWGLGVGVYVSGGARAIYEGVNFAPIFPNTSTDIKADLSVIEYALGTGYEILDGLRVGASWRIVHVNASLGSAAVTQGTSLATTYLSTATLDGLTANRYNGFKVGVQYAPRESKWGVGADWRTEVGFIATADSATGTLTNAATGTPLPTTITNPSASNTFPQQFDVGGHWEFMSKQKIFGQYTFTEYHVDQVLGLSGDITLNATGTSLGSLSSKSINQKWNNLHNLRFGYECDQIETWAFRVGYVLTSPATPKSDARGTFTSPGFGNTFLLGVGKSLLGDMLSIDGGVEYGFASGTVTAADAAPGTYTGDYSSNDFAFHLGATFRI